MSAAHPFQPAELEEALRKVAKREPLRRDEQELVLRTLEEIPLADESDEDGIVLPPEDEAELTRVIATSDENERAGRVIPLDRFLAERGMG